MDNVVHLGAQTVVPEYGELVEPWVVDEAGIAQPVDRELGVIRIRDNGSNNANLQYTGVGGQPRETASRQREGSTHISAGLWASSIMKKGLLRGGFQFGEVFLNGRVRFSECHFTQVFVE